MNDLPPYVYTAGSRKLWATSASVWYAAAAAMQLVKCEPACTTEVDVISSVTHAHAPSLDMMASGQPADDSAKPIGMSVNLDSLHKLNDDGCDAAEIAIKLVTDLHDQARRWVGSERACACAQVAQSEPQALQNLWCSGR